MITSHHCHTSDMSDPIRDYSMKHSAGLDEVVLDMNYFYDEKLVVSIPKQIVVNMMPRLLPRLLPPVPPVSLVPVFLDTNMLWNWTVFEMNLAAGYQDAWHGHTTLSKRPHYAA